MTESHIIIGSLMTEHRLIERVLGDVSMELESIRNGAEPMDLKYVDAVVDFMDSFVGRCHQGKEENILFLDLLGKPLSAELSDTMRDLVFEHIWVRARTNVLVSVNARNEEGDAGAAEEIVDAMARLAAFYPEHMRKEETDFFSAAVDQFSRREQQAMVDKFREFDEMLPIHERYHQLAGEIEARRLDR